MEHSATTYKEHIVWNTTFQIIGKAIGAGAALVGSVIIARRFGVATYGDFTKIVTFVVPFYLISDFGLNAIYLQKSAILKNKTHEAHNHLSTLVMLRFAGSIFLVFVALGALSFLPHGNTQGYTPLVRLGIVLFAPTIIFQSLLTTANALFQERLRYDLSAFATSAGAIVGTLLLWSASIVFSDALGTIASVGALGIGSAVAAGASLWLSRSFAPRIALRCFSQHILPFLKDAFPLGLTLVFNMVYFRIDSFILALTRPTFEVGVYGFAYKIFEFPLAIPTFFMNAVYPLLLQTVKKNSGKVFQTRPPLVSKSGNILFISSIAFVFLFWFFSPLVSWVRPEFQASVAPLRVLSLGLPFFFLTSLTMWTLVAYKKQTALLGIYGVSMAVNILANAFFIPLFGYMAAAWITVCSECLVFGLSWYAMKKISPPEHLV